MRTGKHFRRMSQPKQIGSHVLSPVPSVQAHCAHVPKIASGTAGARSATMDSNSSVLTILLWNLIDLLPASTCRIKCGHFRMASCRYSQRNFLLLFFVLDPTPGLLATCTLLTAYQGKCGWVRAVWVSLTSFSALATESASIDSAGIPSSSSGDAESMTRAILFKSQSVSC